MQPSFCLTQHIGSGASVIASFQQTLWTVVPICSGTVRQKTLGEAQLLFFFQIAAETKMTSGFNRGGKKLKRW